MNIKKFKSVAVAIETYKLLKKIAAADDRSAGMQITYLVKQEAKKKKVSSMSIVLPNLTDEEFSSYNDVNRMRRIIDDFFNRVILTKKATNRSVTSGELKHLIEHWAGLKMNHKQERVYGYSNTYILEPFLVKVMHEKGIALIESNLSESNILFSRCFVGIAQKSIEKLQCFIHQATPDDDFKVKPFYWYAGGPMYKHHRKRLHEIGYDDVWKAHDWKKIYYGKHV